MLIYCMACNQNHFVSVLHAEYLIYMLQCAELDARISDPVNVAPGEGFRCIHQLERAATDPEQYAEAVGNMWECRNMQAGTDPLQTHSCDDGPQGFTIEDDPNS